MLVVRSLGIGCSLCRGFFLSEFRRTCPSVHAGIPTLIQKPRQIDPHESKWTIYGPLCQGPTLVHHLLMTDIQFKLRLPRGLHTQLEAAAQQAERSLTAEIVARLEGTFPREIEQELLEARRDELGKVAWQIQFVEDELYKQRRHFARVSVDILSSEYQEHLALMVKAEARLRQLQDHRNAIELDIARIVKTAEADADKLQVSATTSGKQKKEVPPAHKKPRAKRG